MSYVILDGWAVIDGYEPDGDTIRFVPDDMRAFQRLDRSRLASVGKDTSVCVRLEGIDAPELHYEGAAQPKGKPALDALLSMMQIDGTFVVEHRRLLFEARWRGAETNAADVFAFQGKLRGKLVGTLGLVISVGGFSEDAPDDRLRKGDQRDPRRLAGHRTGSDKRRNVVESREREASRGRQNGQLYYGYQEWLDLEAA